MSTQWYILFLQSPGLLTFPDIFHYFKVSDLPLPRSIKCTIGKLSMRDFHIDLERLGPKDHVRKCYPATCHLTGEDVLIKIFPKSEHFSPSFLSFKLLLILNIIHFYCTHASCYQIKRDSMSIINFLSTYIFVKVKLIVDFRHRLHSFWL